MRRHYQDMTEPLRIGLVVPSSNTTMETELPALFRRRERAAPEGLDVPVISSAGALITALRALGAERIAVIAPYMKPLTTMVTDYIADGGPQVCRSVSLEVADNLAVGRLDPANLIGIADDLDTSDVDALVLSACVQMPSLASIQTVEDRLGLPVVSAATATTYALLTALGLPPHVPGAGRLLTGGVPAGSPAG